MSQATFPDPLGRSRAEIVMEVAIAILICPTAILSNVLVVYVINKCYERRIPTKIFIHNLSLTEIFMVTLYTVTWNLTQVWCHVTPTLRLTMGVASMLNIALIALNRYIKVVQRALYIKFFPGKSCLVVLWSRLAVFSHNRHASVVRIGKAVVRLEFPSLQLWLILCPSNYWRDLGHVNICDILLLLGNLQASEKKVLITLTPMSHKIRLVLPGFIIPTLKF